MKNGARRSRPSALHFEQPNEPDQILVHRTVIRAKPVDQCLDIEFRGLAAHRMPAIDVDGFASGQGVGEGLLGHGDLR